MLRIIAVDRLRARLGDAGDRVKGWILAAETNFSKHGLDQYFRNPDKTTPYLSEEWKKLTYDAVDTRTDSTRMEVMSKQTSTACDGQPCALLCPEKRTWKARVAGA